MKINLNNTAKIDATLAAVNGKSTAHTFTDSYELRQCADRAEKQLDTLKLPKSQRKGAKVHCRSGDKLPNAYKYNRHVTYVTMERGVADWFLTGARRSEAHKESGLTRLLLTVEQDTEVVSRLREQYGLQS